MNLYPPLDNAIDFPNTYPLDSDLKRYPTFELPEPSTYCAFHKHANSKGQKPPS